MCLCLETHTNEAKGQYNAELTLSPRLHVKPIITAMRAIRFYHFGPWQTHNGLKTAEGIFLNQTGGNSTRYAIIVAVFSLLFPIKTRVWYHTTYSRRLIFACVKGRLLCSLKIVPQAEQRVSKKYTGLSNLKTNKVGGTCFKWSAHVHVPPLTPAPPPPPCSRLIN